MRLDMVKVVATMKEKGMRQKDIMERSGLSRNTISAICNGKSCTDDTAKKLAEAFGVKVEELTNN